MAERKYRIWCETEQAYVYEWADTVPTECPNDAGHTIDTDKIAFVKSKGKIKIGSDEGPTLALVSPDGNIEKEVAVDNDGNFNLGDKGVKVGGTNELSVAFTDQTKAYVKRSNSSYGTMCYFLFNGTDKLSTPTAIKIIAWNKTNNKNYSVRVVRQDTGDVIAELVNADNNEVEIKDLGTLSNLPTGPTIFEIQGKTDSGGECRLAFMTISF
jgi:hypothetical protein